MTDAPSRPRFHGFLFYLAACAVCLVAALGLIQLIDHARASATACGSGRPAQPKWKLIERVKVIGPDAPIYAPVPPPPIRLRDMLGPPQIPPPALAPVSLWRRLLSDCD